jgi:hypothetical protein
MNDRNSAFSFSNFFTSAAWSVLYLRHCRRHSVEGQTQETRPKAWRQGEGCALPEAVGGTRTLTSSVTFKTSTPSECLYLVQNRVCSVRGTGAVSDQTL